MVTKKRIGLSALLKKVHSARWQGRRVVFTNGCFDILHVGHIRLLEKAKGLGDLLVVGLNSDASVRALKGPHRPVNPEKVRAEVLAALSSVDFIVIFSETTPEKIIQKIRPHVLVKGGDWKKRGVVGGKFVASCGGKVYLFPVVRGYSTTKLLRKGSDEGLRKRKPLRDH